MKKNGFPTYGFKVIRPESFAKTSSVVPDSDVRDSLIPFRAAKGLIYGFYSHSPWMILIRIKKIPYGLEVTHYPHFDTIWYRWKIRVLKAKI